MRVPARIYATDKMLTTILADNAPEQAANVAHLPGIVKASLAMPDIHWGLRLSHRRYVRRLISIQA
jgi:tRNA-splicing ligase RtcB